MEITNELRAAMRAHAAAQFPRESCGLIVRSPAGPTYVPCENVARNPEDEFALAPTSYLAAESVGPVLAVVHSHPNGTHVPSPADKAAIEQGSLPWVVVAYPEDRVSVTYPSGKVAPLIGRPFHYGISDCFTLLRDYYWEKLKVSFPVPYYSYSWWDLGENLYLDHVEAAGFERVTELQEHDVILMSVKSKVPNHVGIYVGGGMMLHHLANQLSGRTQYGGIWRNTTYGYYRHRGLDRSAPARAPG